MLALIQRVSHAEVSVDDAVVGRIGPGLLALLGVQKDDTRADADRLLRKLLGYRVFADADGKMNLSLADTGQDLLIVSQFTLAADTTRGLRPSFSSAGSPEAAEALYDYFLAQAQAAHPHVTSGRFGADMQVTLTNDGPVTFLLNA